MRTIKHHGKPHGGLFQNHRGFWLLATLTALIHAVLMTIPTLNSDEAFIWNWSRHLALGYYSHPPMSAWSIAAVTALLGKSPFTVRLASLLFHLGTQALVYASARELTRRAPFALLAAALYAVLPVSVILGTMVSSDMGLIFFWSATVFLVKKAVIDRRPRFWYAAGVSAGAMMLSKFFAILFYPGLLLFLVGHPAYRRELARKEPWLAAVLALVVFSPFVYWNATHQWLTLQFNLLNRQGAAGFGIEKPFQYIAGQMLAASPWVLVLLVVALAAGLITQVSRVRKDRGRFSGGAGTEGPGSLADSLLFYAVMVATPLAVFALVSLRSKVGAHWAAVIYPHAMVVLAAWLYDLGDDTARGGREGDAPPLAVHRRWSLIACLVSAALVSLPFMVVVLEPRVLPDRWIYYDEAREEQTQVAQYYGWHEVGARIAELREEHGSLPGGLFLSTRDYSDASLLDFYTPGGADFVLMGYRLQEFHGKEFLYWAKPIKRPGANTLFVLDRPIWPENQQPGNLQRIAPYFREVRRLETMEIRDTEGRLIRKFWFALGLDYQANEPDVLSRW